MFQHTITRRLLWMMSRCRLLFYKMNKETIDKLFNWKIILKMRRDHLMGFDLASLDNKAGYEVKKLNFNYACKISANLLAAIEKIESVIEIESYKSASKERQGKEG
jgi:hypothetical protein